MMRIRLLLGLLGLFYLFALGYTHRIRACLDGSDSWGYYVHLPALLLYHDTGNYDKTIAAWQKEYPGKADPRLDAYGIRPTPKGKLAVKYPIGVALFETPFFLTAHWFCSLSGAYPASGFSAPYLWAVALSSIFFALFGLFFLFKILRYYFSERISLITTAVIGLGTNLFFFVAYTPGMAHPLAFALIAYLLLVTRYWYESPGWQNGLKLGATLGLIAITRTQDLVIVMVPLLWGVRRGPDILKQFRYFWKQRISLGFAFLSFGMALLPQALYWKWVSGQFWYYGYQGEKFDWADPKVQEGLLSFQNGWLIYTPVMWLALWGILAVRRKVPELFWPILVFLPLHWLVSYAWWCWMYINGFGSRPMVDVYALMAFPLAAWIATQKKAWIYFPVLGAFVVLNLFQTWQTHAGIFWSERSNWAYYKEIFVKTKGTERALSAFESGEVQSITSLKRVKSLYPIVLNPDSPEDRVQIEGRSGLQCSKEFCKTIKITNDSTRLFPGDWMLVKVAAFIPPTEIAPGQDQLAKLVVDFSTGQDKILKYRAIKIGTHLNNPKYILWKNRGGGQWGEASFFVMVPMGFDQGSRMTTYVWNPMGQNIVVGDIQVELWR